MFQLKMTDLHDTEGRRTVPLRTVLTKKEANIMLYDYAVEAQGIERPIIRSWTGYDGNTVYDIGRSNYFKIVEVEE